MIANQETMVNTFWGCNEKYFDNSLPTPWFETVNSVNVIGKFECHRNGKKSKKPIVDQVIKMSDCFDYPEKDFVETMVHEMIHYYIAWNRIKVVRSHGRVFMRMANEMKEKYGLDVTRKIDASAFKLTENATKLVTKKMKEMKSLDYKLVDEAFAREGWTKYIQFMAGNRYVKGNDTVTCYFGHFRLNGKSVSEAYICEMLHLGDKRMIQVCGAVAPDSIFSKYGQAFLAGVRWADEHPIDKQESEYEER